MSPAPAAVAAAMTAGAGTAAALDRRAAAPLLLRHRTAARSIAAPRGNRAPHRPDDAGKARQPPPSWTGSAIARERRGHRARLLQLANPADLCAQLLLYCCCRAGMQVKMHVHVQVHRQSDSVAWVGVNQGAVRVSQHKARARSCARRAFSRLAQAAGGARSPPGRQRLRAIAPPGTLPGEQCASATHATPHLHQPPSRRAPCGPARAIQSNLPEVKAQGLVPAAAAAAAHSRHTAYIWAVIQAAHVTLVVFDNHGAN